MAEGLKLASDAVKEASAASTPNGNTGSYERKNKYFLENNVYVIFVKDGADVNEEDTRSLKVDISAYVRKYMMPAPKFLSAVPEAHIEVQRKFYRRSFTELLDRCSYSISETKDDVELTEMFRIMWTPNGKKIELMEQLIDYVYNRSKESDQVPLILLSKHKQKPGNLKRIKAYSNAYITDTTISTQNTTRFIGLKNAN